MLRSVRRHIGPTRQPGRFASSLATLLVALVAATGALLPAASPARAADVTMTARVLLDGHTRLGTWAAIEVGLANDGPAIVGELRLTAGSQGSTRYAAAVDLPTGSRKTHTLYAQPSVFRSNIEILLVDGGGQQVAGVSVKTQNHDVYSPLVAIVAERPQGLVRGVTAAVSVSQQQPAATVITLTLDELPERVEAWGPLDRLVWQEIDTAQLSTAQLAALRGWVAAGGRLVLVGGTSGAAVFAGLDPELLPFRPTRTVDVPTAELAALLGSLPGEATPLPALAGTLDRGRPLIRAGDLVVAAETRYGSGSVTLVGFDPSTPWLADTKAGDTLWRRLVPVGAGPATSPLAIADDWMLVQALYYLPALELPPVGGLLLLLAGYIVLIGPVNYLVLRRLDRREWAWITMPALVLVFSVAAYGVGLALHGTDLIVNQVAIVRGAAGTDAGRGQVYLGLYSPTRRSFDIAVGSGALVTTPTTQNQPFGAEPGLDVLQGETARVRGLEVNPASLRVFRGEAAFPAPLVEADLHLEGDTLRGTVTNRSGRTLERPAVVLGTQLAILPDLADGASAPVSLKLSGAFFGMSLSDRLFGQGAYDPDTARTTAVRRSVIDQLTQGWGKFGPGTLASEGPLLLAWGSDPILAVQIGAERPQAVSQALYLVALPMRISGAVTLREPLIGRHIVETDAAWASDDGYAFSLGKGTMTVSWEPVALDGSFTATRLVVGLTGGGEQFPELPEPGPAPLPTVPPGEGTGTWSGGTGSTGAGTSSGTSGAGTGSGGGDTGTGGDPGPTPPPPPAVVQSGGFREGVPTLELFDRSAATWVAFEPLGYGESREIEHPERYVDPASGSLLVRFGYPDPQNSGQQLYFNFGVRLEGVVE